MSATNVGLIGAWLTFPLLLLALSLGCGLLVDRLTGGALPGTLLAPVGLAAIVVESHLLTLDGGTAELAVPAAIVVAAAGFVTARGRLGATDWAAAGAAAGVFAVFAAPVVLSGEATFAGYIKLDDTATWLAITDHVLQHGRDVGGLAPSTHEATLALNIEGGYPIGAFFPLSIGAALLPTDPAWTFQPYECLLAAMLALALYELTGRLIARRALRAGIAFVGAQPALLYGYALWGGVKEVAAAALVALIAALAAWTVEERRLGPAMTRAVVPALASAALVAVLSFGGVVWLAPVLLPAAVVALATRRIVEPVLMGAVFVVAAAAFAYPSLRTAKPFLEPAQSVITNDEELGNLLAPLKVWQLAGVWPAGDFRVEPDRLGVTHVLVLIVVAGALVALATAIARRAWGLAAFAAGPPLTALVLVAVSSPWIEAKALATASPALLTAALVACALALEGRHRAVGALAAGLVVAAVLWSNALAYHDVSLAPRDRLAELEEIGERIDGEGPALMTDYEPYGVRHFLRDADPEGASELRRRYVYLRTGRYLGKGQTADIDAFRLDQVLVYRTLVLRRGPQQSRPPSIYRRTWSGRWYEVWQRDPGSEGRVAEHMSLGSASSPVSRPDCAAVERLAAVAGPGGSLAAATQLEPTVVPVSVPARGQVRLPIDTPEAPVDLWIGGSLRRTLVVTVDGDEVARIRHQLEPAGQYIPLARIRPGAGRHTVGLRLEDSRLRPGGGGPASPLGPLVLRPDGGKADPAPVLTLPAARARELCRGPLDWIEAIRPR